MYYYISIPLQFNYNQFASAADLQYRIVLLLDLLNTMPVHTDKVVPAGMMVITTKMFLKYPPIKSLILCKKHQLRPMSFIQWHHQLYSGGKWHLEGLVYM